MHELAWWSGLVLDGVVGELLVELLVDRIVLLLVDAELGGEGLRVPDLNQRMGKKMHSNS